MPRVAVPSDDGVLIAGHFGRCASFIVFETDDAHIVGTETRPNGVTAHARGECHGEQVQQPDPGRGHGHGHEHGHSHAGMVEVLHDCSVILCRGMGWRAAEALKANGMEPFVVEAEMPARQAVEAYLDGSLRTSTSFCACHH